MKKSLGTEHSANHEETFAEKIQRGLRLSFQRMLEEKKLRNQLVVIMRGDEIVHVRPEELMK